MALTGKFLADFSAFVSEAQRAEVALDALTRSSVTTGKAFETMVRDFSGAKVIQEAGLMASVFEAAGGRAKFTTAELARMAAAAGEATEKFAALGVRVPAGIQRLAAESAAAAPQVNTLSGALNQFDGVLAAMGVHLGPEVRALGELGTASGKSASDLGLLGTAGLVVGAGIGGWKLGRVIADFTGSDEAIGQATASLLGWGSVADQVAGVKADALALASRRIGFEVTSITTALAINTGWQDKWASNAEISAAKVAAWHAELAKVGTDLPSLTADLASHNFSLADLAKRYGVSVEALQLFGRETKAAADAEKTASDSIHANNARLLKDQQEALDSTKAWRGAMEELNSSGEGWKGTLDTIDGTVVEAIKHYLAAGVAQGALATAYGLTAVQVKAVASARADEQAGLKRIEDAAKAAAAAARELERDFVKAHEKAAAASKKQNEELDRTRKLAAEIRAMGGSTQYDLGTAEGRSSVPADVARLLHDGYSFKQANLLAYALRMGFDASHDPILAIKGPAVPGFAGGVSDFAGGMAIVGERGPELVSLPPHSSVTPGVGGQTNIFNLYGTPAELVEQVKNAIARQYLRRGPI